MYLNWPEQSSCYPTARNARGRVNRAAGLHYSNEIIHGLTIERRMEDNEDIVFARSFIDSCSSASKRSLQLAQSF